jgi:hypothetical protein
MTKSKIMTFLPYFKTAITYPKNRTSKIGSLFIPLDWIARFFNIRRVNIIFKIQSVSGCLGAHS